MKRSTVLFLLGAVTLPLVSQTPAPAGTLVSNTQWPRTADLATRAVYVMRIDGVANAETAGWSQRTMRT